jgi:hypothetical protein
MIFRKAHPCLLQPYTISLIETCEWPAILSAALKCTKSASTRDDSVGKDASRMFLRRREARLFSIGIA